MSKTKGLSESLLDSSAVQCLKSFYTFSPAAVSFTDGEKEQLKKFTNRSYLLDKASRNQVWLSLVDILLTYSYEVRSTEGEHNVSVCVCVCVWVGRDNSS